MLTILTAAAILLLLSSAYVLRRRRWERRTAWPRVLLLITAWASALWIVFMLATFIVAIREGV